jgi:hypothetical protein
MMQELRFFLNRLKGRVQRDARLPQLWMMRLVCDLPSVPLKTIIQNDIKIEAPILDDICLPPYHGKNNHDDFTPLMKIARLLQPNIVIELGTGYGNLTANICRQCPSAWIYTVNAPAEEQTGTYFTFKLTRDEIGRVYRTYGFADRVVQIFRNTLYLNLSEYFDNPIIDLAVIDACHDRGYVINDFIKIAPFIRSHGIVLLHDTFPTTKGHLRGSYAACLSLRKRGFDIKHISGTWWAIWLKK